MFVKAILTPDCKGFAFYTTSGKPPFRTTPTVNYTKSVSGGELTLHYNYSSLKFASSGPQKAADSITTKVVDLPNGFSFTLSFTKSKVYLIFNGRLLFMDISDVMLMDDFDYATQFKTSKPVASVDGCPASKQRVIIRKTSYVRTFNYASAHWVTNQRPLGPIVAGDIVMCSSLSAPCGPKVSAPVVCQPTSNDFYFTALRLGHARKDVELMRQQDKGRNLSIALINGKQVSQHNDYEFFVNEDGKWS
ncbi:hypothetical protein Tcan_05764 [Toxocara canis]|uniref:Uncharacterized protein n=1 Tax=Toxocara canis TaxID=6265 RepID=A0A0B2VX50_TOXCA|nr:hypothetical protein Tcan_05764 [Toxocara canis]